MDKLIIEGGVPLRGQVAISGAKNATLPLMAATLLANGAHSFGNVPRLRDIRTMQTLLTHMGARCDHNDRLHLDTTRIHRLEAPYELVKTMRAAVLVLGPLVARYQKARVSLPGGCAIGARPINYHLKGLQQMGADITLEHGYVEARARRLQGSVIAFEQVTVTGTENLLMAATLAEGTTLLQNAAREPEVVDLACYLRKMGALIEGDGTEEIRVQGVAELLPATHQVMADRIELGTYLVAAGITGGRLQLTNCQPAHVEAIISALQLAGMQFAVREQSIDAWGDAAIHSVDVKTWPYPGFPTDMQAQFMALMALGDGVSHITEQIFEKRFMHVSELRRLGADIEVEGQNAMIRGVPGLSGAPVMATDLRASASLVLAGLAAEGTTEINRVYHLDRGYESIEKKLEAVGARIRRLRA